MWSADEIADRPAYELAAAIRRRELSAVEVMQAYLERIRRFNPQLVALVFCLPEAACLRLATAADDALAAGASIGPLHGLPIALKDLMDVAGMPTTHGSRLYATHVATRDCVLAEKLRAAGALIIGKTNTPEHGLGTLTFNELFGVTRNPWNLDLHAGGSSGGAAAAVAAGLLPFADGSDSGGSLRYPASFCHVLGLRPSFGRVPSGRPGDAWSPHAVLGPMARNARDTLLLLAGMSGGDLRAPLSWDEPWPDPEHWQGRPLRGVRMAWSDDLGGLPIGEDVRQVMAQLRCRLEAEGCIIEDAEPDFYDADACWEIIEMHEFFASCIEDYRRAPLALGADLRRNVEQGWAQTTEQLAWAQTARTELFRATAALLRRYDYLIAPTAPVTAPPVQFRWVNEIAGVTLHRYFEWQRCASRTTVTAHPVLALPAGFTAQGLPVGFQLIGRHRDELGLLAFAQSWEECSGYAQHKPELAIG